MLTTLPLSSPWYRLVWHVIDTLRFAPLLRNITIPHSSSGKHNPLSSRIKDILPSSPFSWYLAPASSGMRERHLSCLKVPVQAPMSPPKPFHPSSFSFPPVPSLGGGLLRAQQLGITYSKVVYWGWCTHALYPTSGARYPSPESRTGTTICWPKSGVRFWDVEKKRCLNTQQWVSLLIFIVCYHFSLLTRWFKTWHKWFQGRIRG